MFGSPMPYRNANPLTWEKIDLSHTNETILASIQSDCRYNIIALRPDIRNKNIFAKYRPMQKDVFDNDFFLPSIVQGLRRPWESLVVCSTRGDVEFPNRVRDICLNNNRAYLDWDFTSEEMGAAHALLHNGAVIAFNLPADYNKFARLLSEIDDYPLNYPMLPAIPHVFLDDIVHGRDQAIWSLPRKAYYRWTVGCSDYYELADVLGSDFAACLLTACHTRLLFGVEGERETSLFSKLIGQPVNLPSGEFYLCSRGQGDIWFPTRASFFHPAVQGFRYEGALSECEIVDCEEKPL